MFTISRFKAKRSGHQITVDGLDEEGNQVKRFFSGIHGPDDGRVEFPDKTVGIALDGTMTVLA